jgi:hypothetical protein
MFITQNELKIANFFEIYLEKLKQKLDLNRFKYEMTISNTDLYHFPDVSLQFDSHKLQVKEWKCDSIEVDYKNVLYLNNSITNENIVCLATKLPGKSDVDKFSQNCTESIGTKLPNLNEVEDQQRNICSFILFAKHIDQIDEAIREYAINVSNQLNSIPAVRIEKPDSNAACSNIESHTCLACPMQQYLSLCELLNKLDAPINSRENRQSNRNVRINELLIEKLNNNFDSDDQNYIFEFLDAHTDILNSHENYVQINELIMCVVYMICKQKQVNHLIDLFDEKVHSSLNVRGKQHFTSIGAFNRDQGDACEPTKPFELVRNMSQSDARPLRQSSTFHQPFDLTKLVEGADVKADKKEAKLKRTVPHVRLERSHTIDLTDVSKLAEKRQIALSNKSRLEASQFHSKLDDLLGKMMKHRINNLNVATDQNATTSTQPASSFKKYIFNRVVGLPTLHFSQIMSENDKFQSGDMKEKVENSLDTNSRFKSNRDVIKLWKKIISDQILLKKMEKDLKAKFATASNLSQKQTPDQPEKSLALNRSNEPDVDYGWIQGLEEYFKSKEEIHTNKHQELLKQIYKTGFPKSQRESLWFKFIENSRDKNKRVRNNPREKESYDELLKQSTIHQHTIQLDLNRTFPNHFNFSKKNGQQGQLALFNVLKAYAIVDPEVGYCQGLSFIVGILLINLNNCEEKAFELLKFLLIDLNLREQYKPDMIALQKHLYQFSRLLHDFYVDIFSHLEQNDVSASLYAATWFLTLFSSQFQIEFATRVFDLLFAECSSRVLFKITLAIFCVHEPILFGFSSFEMIINYIKLTIPEINRLEADLILTKAFDFHVDTNLHRYEIEFELFKDEFDAANIANSAKSNSRLIGSQINRCETCANEEKKSSLLAELKSDNSNLKKQLKDLIDKNQLLQLKMTNQEDSFFKLQFENKQMKCKTDTLEIERSNLLTKINEQDHLIAQLTHFSHMSNSSLNKKPFL